MKDKGKMKDYIINTISIVQIAITMPFAVFFKGCLTAKYKYIDTCCCNSVELYKIFSWTGLVVFTIVIVLVFLFGISKITDKEEDK